uniref:Uncharacterized protein n=1 Tax=Magallana gigas TaxID=29159 RepID=K1QIM8_MAGGI
MIIAKINSRQYFGYTINRQRRCAPVNFMCSMSYDFSTGCFVCAGKFINSSGNANQLTTTTMAPFTNTVKGQLKCKHTALNCPHFMIQYDNDGCPYCSSGGPGSMNINGFLNHGAETNCLTFSEFMKCPMQCHYTDPIDGCNKCTCDSNGCPPFPPSCPGPCGNFDPVTFCPTCDYSICGMTPPPVSATTSSKCPAMFCVLNCPNGFKKDPNGCDRCECF